MAAFDSELTSTIQDVEKQLNALNNFSNPADIRERLVKIESKVKGLTSTLHHLQTELRANDDRSQATKLTKAAADHEKKIKEIKQRIKDVKDRLQGGGGAGGAPGSPNSAVGPMRGDGKDAARQKAQNVENLQQAQIETLKRVQQTVEETKAIGDEATTTLKKQTDQIVRINEKLDNLDTEINRGKKELSAIIRRMMTDKILLCCIFLIVAAIITVIVLKVNNPFEDDQTRSETTTTTRAPAEPKPTAAPAALARPPALSF